MISDSLLICNEENEKTFDKVQKDVYNFNN